MGVLPSKVTSFPINLKMFTKTFDKIESYILSCQQSLKIITACAGDFIITEITEVFGQLTLLEVHLQVETILIPSDMYIAIRTDRWMKHYSHSN